MFYVAEIHTDAPGIGFTIPDIPGFSAHHEGTDLTAAVAEAQDVLRDHLAAMVDDGRPIPEARPLMEVIEELKAENDGTAPMTVALRAILPVGRTMRVNMTIDQNTLEMIDEEAKVRGLTRSALVVAAAQAFVRPTPSPLDPDRIARVLGAIDREAGANAAQGGILDILHGATTPEAALRRGLTLGLLAKQATDKSLLPL